MFFKFSLKNKIKFKALQFFYFFKSQYFKFIKLNLRSYSVVNENKTLKNIF